MKKHEIIGLLIVLLISTVYSFVLPEENVAKIVLEPEITIIVEGCYNETLIFNQTPTIGDVLEKLKIENVYGFDQTVVLESQSVFYIPDASLELISLNNATIDELVTIKGIGPKTAQ